MNQAEALGARMVMLQRRLWGQQEEIKRTEQQIDALWLEIRQAPASEVYASTAELPRIIPDVIPEVRPVNPNRDDGGHTYNLAAVAETLNLPAPVACPPGCIEQRSHMHYADGRMVALNEWTSQPETS